MIENALSPYFRKLKNGECGGGVKAGEPRPLPASAFLQGPVTKGTGFSMASRPRQGGVCAGGGLLCFISDIEPRSSSGLVERQSPNLWPIFRTQSGFDHLNELALD